MLKVTIHPGFSTTVLYFWVLSWISQCPGFVLDLKSTKFVQLILSKIIKIVATRCYTSRLQCTKFDFGWGSTPDSGGRRERGEECPGFAFEIFYGHLRYAGIMSSWPREAISQRATPLCLSFTQPFDMLSEECRVHCMNLHYIGLQ